MRIWGVSDCSFTCERLMNDSDRQKTGENISSKKRVRGISLTTAVAGDRKNEM